MVGGVALGVAGTGVVGHTRVQAVGVDAHLSDGALGVAAAAHCKKGENSNETSCSTEQVDSKFRYRYRYLVVKTNFAMLNGQHRDQFLCSLCPPSPPPHPRDRNSDGTLQEATEGRTTLTTANEVHVLNSLGSLIYSFAQRNHFYAHFRNQIDSMTRCRNTRRVGNINFKFSP
jgi:hypothetical protein